MSRTLVVYFSRTGNTKKVATLLAQSLGADMEEIVDRTERFGIKGYLRSVREAFLGTIPNIEPGTHNAGIYDLVVIGSPTWNASLSSPVRAYVRKNRGLFGRVAFFATCGRQFADRAVRQMEREAGRRPIATLTLTESQLSSEDYRAEIESFLRAIREGGEASGSRSVATDGRSAHAQA